MKGALAGVCTVLQEESSHPLGKEYCDGVSQGSPR